MSVPGAQEAESDMRTVHVSPGSELARVLERAAGQAVLLEKDGIRYALVPAADLERLARLDVERAERRLVLEQMRAPFRNTPPEEIEHQVALAVEEARRELRNRERVGQHP
jgi:hypothetical protein